MPKIIHEPTQLMNLNRDELDEILLEQYNNSGLLRELIRVSLLKLKEQTELINFYKEKNDNDLDKFRLIDKYIKENF
ncbi:hypothetical protein [Clostridium sp. M14]|uniref:hypothetical protein n=1 Tax=Clostridium sp. M14 TaxID=2716311 RepID=UPI0013EEC569|nr:hypothetical protein [Clostridium sp. M14]MBZ9693282.1 hypothetical protein [Clostridium sp. M14]